MTRLAPADKAAVVAKVRALAAQNLSGSEIGRRLEWKRNTVASFCTRHKIKLTSIKRQAVAAPPIKYTMPLVTHVVTERSPVSAPKHPPRCTWFECVEPSIAPGKPYCTKHHVKGGGLFHA